MISSTDPAPVVERDEADHTSRPLIGAVALLSAAAGLIHAAVIDSHRGHGAAAGIFTAIAVFQVGWAALVLFRPDRRILAGGAAVNAAIVAGWALNRTTGIPFIDGFQEVEAVGLSDAVGAAFEVLLVLGVAALLLPASKRQWLTGGIANLGLGIAGATVALLAVPAVAGAGSFHDHGQSELAAHGDGGHADGDSHHDGAEVAAAGHDESDHDESDHDESDHDESDHDDADHDDQSGDVVVAAAGDRDEGDHHGSAAGSVRRSADGHGSPGHAATPHGHTQATGARGLSRLAAGHGDTHADGHTGTPAGHTGSTGSTSGHAHTPAGRTGTPAAHSGPASGHTGTPAGHTGPAGEHADSGHPGTHTEVPAGETRPPTGHTGAHGEGPGHEPGPSSDGHAGHGTVSPPSSGGVTPEQQAAADRLLADTEAALPQFTDEAAHAAGFRSIGDGGTGTEHLLNWDWITDDVVLDPNRPESLVYNVSPDGTRQLAAAMFILPPGAEVPDIGGTLTQWHIHNNLCFSPATDVDGHPARRVVGLTSPEGTCGRGERLPDAAMLHVWIVDHPCGPFSALEGVGAGQAIDEAQDPDADPACQHSAH